jgi:hypothetical protein
MHNNYSDAKSSIFTLLAALSSQELGWIKASTIYETIIVAVISTIIGFYGTKLLRYIDIKIKDWKK